MPGLRAVDEQSRCLGTNKILPFAIPASLLAAGSRVGHQSTADNQYATAYDCTTQFCTFFFLRSHADAAQLAPTIPVGQSGGHCNDQVTDAPASRCRLSLVACWRMCSSMCFLAGYVPTAQSFTSSSAGALRAIASLLALRPRAPTAQQAAENKVGSSFRVLSLGRGARPLVDPQLMSYDWHWLRRLGIPEGRGG